MKFCISKLLKYLHAQVLLEWNQRFALVFKLGSADNSSLKKVCDSSTTKHSPNKIFKHGYGKKTPPFIQKQTNKTQQTPEFPIPPVF